MTEEKTKEMTNPVVIYTQTVPSIYGEIEIEKVSCRVVWCDQTRRVVCEREYYDAMGIAGWQPLHDKQVVTDLLMKCVDMQAFTLMAKGFEVVCDE